MWVALAEKHLPIYHALVKGRNISFVICDDPESVFYDIHDYLYHQTDFYDKFEFATIIGEECDIHRSAIIDFGVKIGNNVKIGANTVVRKGTIIGDNCEIGCNTTIGSEGFQIVRCNGSNRKIVHSGGVLVGDCVNIGDNVTICNSLFEDTARIERGVMIDNHAYIAHNVVIGANAVITASVVLCGSSVVEREAWVGVNSSVLNRVRIGAEAFVGMGSVVTRDVIQGGLVYGVPAKLID